MEIVLVVAIARNGVIGRDNGLPWRLRSDMKLFREMTMGKPLVMGRKTFASIGKPLDGRDNIVVTGDAEFAVPGVTRAPDPDTALEIARDAAERMGADEICVIGGATIYAALIDRADRLIVTEVALDPVGDTRFPAIDPAIWRETARAHHEQGDKDDAAFDLVTYERIG